MNEAIARTLLQLLHGKKHFLGLNGKFYVQWLDRDSQVLSSYFGDVPVTTDFRRVFSEHMIRRMANNHIGLVFPAYSGLRHQASSQGSDLTPQYGTNGVDINTVTIRSALPSQPAQPAYGESLMDVGILPGQNTGLREFIERVGNLFRGLSRPKSKAVFA